MTRIKPLKQNKATQNLALNKDPKDAKEFCEYRSKAQPVSFWNTEEKMTLMIVFPVNMIIGVIHIQKAKYILECQD